MLSRCFLSLRVPTVQALLFLEEMASIVMTPFVLYFALPQCAPAILAFVRDFTVHAPGVGDICSMAAFDFERHGNAKYGSPSQAPKVWLSLSSVHPCQATISKHMLSHGGLVARGCLTKFSKDYTTEVIFQE